ncbi:hypothetical protein LIER_19361 [Lithospermum erythrorhizon]|uniref:Transmembrane protein n=1 Tax=Lithospermum erythrorhizon TaxID=34254 RepID=A0AAV3QJS3_LITER
MGKSHRLAFEESTFVSSTPLKLVVSDVWGPAPIVSNKGFKFYVHFRLILIFLLYYCLSFGFILGYQCLHLLTGRTYISRHVVFDEQLFLFTTLTSNDTVSPGVVIGPVFSRSGTGPVLVSVHPEPD